MSSDSTTDIQVIRRGSRLVMKAEKGVAYSVVSLDSVEQPAYLPIQAAIDIYHENHPLKTVLVLGGGGCTIPRYVLQKYPDARCTVVEYSAEVIFLCQQYFLEGLDCTRLQLVHGDAFEYVKTPSDFDIVFVDLFEGGRLQDICHETFLQDLSNVLSGEGMILFNLFHINGAQTIEEAAAPCRQFEALCQKVFKKTALIADEQSNAHYLVGMGK